MGRKGMGELGRGVIFWGLFTTMVHAIWFLTSFFLPPFSAKNFIHSQYIPIINGVELIFFSLLKGSHLPPSHLNLYSCIEQLFKAYVLDLLIYIQEIIREVGVGFFGTG